MSRVMWAAFILGLPGVAAAGKPSADAEILFVQRVLPVLQSRCIACHGNDPKSLKGELDLTSRASVLRGGTSGTPGLVPGKAEESLLYRAVSRQDADVSPMPPKASDKLTQAEIQWVREWINGGAPWPAAERIRQVRESLKESGIKVVTSGGLSPEWTNRSYQPEDLWAYRPIRRPDITSSRRGSHPIDAMIQSKLESLRLEAAPPADRRTLLRRVTFDLTGLPPTPHDLEAFIRDVDPDEVALAKVVDRLLSSPHYGEQMAQHWLDVTRYADSSGFANDYERGNAWRYRDYVVRSFNADKPYRQFVMEQLAGDEIDPSNPEMLIALGFLRQGPWELTGMEVPKIARQRFLDDVTDAVGQVFLGHMLQCARCHDHKFDPVPTRDYYRIQAAFATTQIAERPAPFLPSENISGFDEKRVLDARRAFFEENLKRIAKLENDGRAQWEKEHPESKGLKPPRHEFLTPADLGMERIARKGLERLKWEYDRYEPVTHAVYTGATPAVRNVSAPFRVPRDLNIGELETCHILAGGDPFSPKERVSPGVLSAAGDAPLPDSISGRRRALAAWIGNPRNPLTARVMANRIWQWTMGIPLAGNPNNFGATGKKPTHPELLDWLAVELMESDWSIKHVQRQILLTSAYRRSARHPDPQQVRLKDPTGTSYAAFRPRRLTAEELRDSMLAVSGELNPTLGGIPVRPEIHADIAFQPRQVMGTFAPAWEPSSRPDQRNRRTLYALKLRGLRDAMLEVFNAPSADVSCEERSVSTVAPQALALLNGESTRSRALAFAARLHMEGRQPRETIEQAIRLTFSRPATSSELDVCLAHWKAMTERHRHLTFKKPLRPTEVRREAVEENTGVPFAYTEPLPGADGFMPDLHPADVTAEVRGLMEVCLVLFNSNEFIHLD